jgi:thiamine pyrophosphokinase
MPMQAIVLADGDVAPRARIDEAWPGWSDPVALVVAADGGLRHWAALGLRPSIWVGDGDSVVPRDLERLEADGAEIRRVASAKDESDTELAVLVALERGADEIVILGALGGARIDHALANVGLLAHPELAGRRALLLDAGARVSFLRAPASDGSAIERPLPGRIGDLVSLLPFGDGVGGVTTSGLAYPLTDEALPAGPARGLSNVREDPRATVTVRRGMLLIVESPATLQR